MNRYGSLIHIERTTAQDHCAILIGMGKYAEHRCHADVRMSPVVGFYVAMDRLRDSAVQGVSGFLRDDDTGSRTVRYMNTFDAETEMANRVQWIPNERITWDYTGGIVAAPLGFICDCIFCLAQ